MKANKKILQSTKYPGGGMLRNKYQDGGAVRGYGMSRGQMSAAIASRPPVRPSASTLASRVKAFNPKNEDPKEMYERFITPGLGPTEEITDIMYDVGLPIDYMGSRIRKTYIETPMMSGYRPRSTPTAQRASTPTAQRAAASPTAQRASAPATAQGGSFSQSFAKARAAGAKEFTWNGKQYTTQLKGESTAKPQATQTRDTTPVQKMPSKVVTSVSKPYFESPTGKQVPAMAKASFPAATPNATTALREAIAKRNAESASAPKPGPVGNVGRGLAAAQSAIEQRKAEQSKASTPTAQSTQYFKPGTMADYLEERRRKMQGPYSLKK